MNLKSKSQSVMMSTRLHYRRNRYKKLARLSCYCNRRLIADLAMWESSFVEDGGPLAIYSNLNDYRHLNGIKERELA